MRIDETPFPSQENLSQWGYFYCDTNILRFLVETKDKWKRLEEYLIVQKLILVISWVNIVEMVKLPKYHRDLSQLLLQVPTAILKMRQDIIRKEILEYPNKVNNIINYPLLRFMLDSRDKVGQLQKILGAEDVEAMFSVLGELKLDYPPKMDWLKNTKPKEDFIDTDFELHNYGWVVDDVRQENEEFVREFRDQPSHFRASHFRGSMLAAAYNYYKYILKTYEPGPTDVADLHQIYYFPYCKHIVIEKEMAGLLSQIKRERGLLAETKIDSIRFARTL